MLSKSKMTFKEISAYKAIKEIYKHKNAWQFLYGFIDESEEIEEDESGNLYFIYWNEKNTDNNFYTNEEKFFWIAGYDNNKICFLQLIGRQSGVHLDLVVAQKKYTMETENCFGNLIDYIKEKYDKIKYISTFPMNKTLEEYYRSKGFRTWEKHNELRLDLKK